MNLLANLPLFDSAQDAFLAVIQTILSREEWAEPTLDPTSIGSLFGSKSRRTKEILCTGFVLKDVRKRLIDVPPRRIDLPFAFANFIWTLRGENDVSSITYYNPKGKLFSDDGKHYAGALGYRMQHTPKGSQLSAVIETLRKDPASRRAVIQFYSNTDSIVKPRDTPCIVSMHFLIRQGKLISIVNMRSQSALMVMPYDLVVYTMLHELVAAELDINPGLFFHVCDSLHVYEDEIQMAEGVLACAKAAFKPHAMQAMPGSPMRIMPQIFELERDIRKRYFSTSHTVRMAGVPQFWSDIIKVLAIGVARKGGFPDAPDLPQIPTDYERWLTQK